MVLFEKKINKEENNAKCLLDNIIISIYEGK